MAAQFTNFPHGRKYRRHEAFGFVSIWRNRGIAAIYLLNPLNKAVF